MRPLVVTLEVDEASQRFFDEERSRWFPPGRTEVGAHVTCFHAVPGELEEQVRADLVENAGPAFVARVDSVRSLGRGAAYGLDSTELVARHRELQRAWWDHLTRQDRQGLRPHVTVCNKVSPDEGRATVATIRAGFVPWTLRATGWQLWRYEGGPWAPVARVPFPEGA